MTTGKGRGARRDCPHKLSNPRTIIKEVPIILYSFLHVIRTNTASGAFKITLPIHAMLFHPNINVSKILQGTEMTVATTQFMNATVPCINECYSTLPMVSFV